MGARRPLPVGFAKDLEGPTSDASPAGDIAFHALRPYQLGDDHRHIHWMSTARTGTLMVRHYVDNRRPTLAVLLDDATRRTTTTRSSSPSRSRRRCVMSCMALQAADLRPFDLGVAHGAVTARKVATACSRR